MPWRKGTVENLLCADDVGHRSKGRAGALRYEASCARLCRPGGLHYQFNQGFIISGGTISYSHNFAKRVSASPK